MKQKPSEFAAFDKIMGGLLAVPYAELHEKIAEEKRTKAALKKPPPTSLTSSRASSNSRKRVA